ncbi:MAG: MarC family protein [Crocinitomicaceae bacterium]|nr:MarC family protein [Crocinitomicaceae bacterium]MDG1658500.1 MarC family protein [Crocinitomicaceae bacterium]
MEKFFTGFNWTEMFKATMVLFAVIDIVGSIPIIIKLKEKSGDIHAGWATSVSFVIMVAFLLLGDSILGLFGVEVEAFAVAGAFILFAMALEMILGIELFKESGTQKTASIVPLAFPIIAGAGAMTSIISLRAEFAVINILVAICINVIIVFAVLKSTRLIERILGPGGIAILKKVFGIILLAIAVKLFSSNLKALLNDPQDNAAAAQTELVIED